jgi:hypothetical protein
VIAHLYTSLETNMQLTDILAQTGGLQSMARELGLSESQAASGATALLPAVLGGFQKQAESQPEGIAGLSGRLSQWGGGELLDDVLSSAPTHTDRGDNVLGQIFGSKDVSRAVAQNAASQSGLDAGVLKKMLPMLAMVLAGYMAKKGGAGAGLTGGGLGGLAGMLGGGTAPTGAGLGGGLGSMLDRNGDGNPLDDIMRMAGKVLR